ncbi:hypothetical protein ACFORO_26005 [Amycolatopsis halotolerans]|uniref:Uncharacterized protein n=1 Tax=Amycolatopsis halotolerans TaxID=330083 RepID=A0ABV7QMV7_9PSEU
MNITEANDTSRVLRYLLAVRQGTHTAADGDVREAAARLAGRVNKALHTGITPEQIDAQWDAR